MTTAQTAQHLQSTVTLHNGVSMPWFGLGVFKVEEGSELIEAVKMRLNMDTATLILPQYTAMKPVLAKRLQKLSKKTT